MDRSDRGVTRGNERGSFTGGVRGGYRGAIRGGLRGLKRGGGVEREERSKKRNVVKRVQEKAHLTALLSTKKSYSLQRLMRDYKEIQNQSFLVVGVSALPLEDDFYEWHGNVKALSDGPFKGAIMHIQFMFPQDYPLNPPKIKILNRNSIKHANIMSDNSICLDMLEKTQTLYRGWTSAYTVLSILIQLQNFFFEIEEQYTEQELKQMPKLVREMNEYHCSYCKHKGSMNPWPEFLKVDTENLKMTKEKY